MKKICLSLLLLFPFSWGGESTATWIADDTDPWPHRIEIEVQSSQVDANLTDYPVYVDLSDLPQAFWEDSDGAGTDDVEPTESQIRITKSDGTTEVPFEITNFNDAGTTGTGELHFKADGTLSSSSNTSFYIYYGNTSSASYAEDYNPYGSEYVWDSNYKGIWHFDESDVNNIQDSTNNDADEDTAATSEATHTDAIMDKGYDLDGSNDSIIINDPTGSPLSPTSALQFEMWFKADTIGSDVLLGFRQNSTSAGYGFWFWSSNLRAQIGSSGWTDLAYALTNINTGTWYHAVGNWDGSTYKMYVNGTEVVSDTYGGSQSYSGGTQMTIGKRAPQQDYFDGIIDEVRVSDTARSSGWISTQYNNQNSPGTFYTMGTEEDKPASGPGKRKAMMISEALPLILSILKF